jgi:hypothetical protein
VVRRLENDIGAMDMNQGAAGEQRKDITVKKPDQFFLIKTDGKNYELFKVCNDISEVILFTQIFDLEHPPGTGYDLIITSREHSRVETYFSKQIKKVRQREWIRTSLDTGERG